MERYIGNIVVFSRMNMKTDNCYRKCSSMLDIDPSLPTIIIGLENARENIPDFSILRKKYNEGMLWWTFTKTERRVDFEKDMEEFYEYCISHITEGMDYVYIDPLKLSFSDVKEYIRLLNKPNGKFYYVDNNKFVFIYDIGGNKGMYGISLTTCEFWGIEKDKILNLIGRNPKNRRIKNFYAIPNRVRRMINGDIPRELMLLTYFI